jgi:transcription initiation factor TFIID subunit 6
VIRVGKHKLVHAGLSDLVPYMVQLVADGVASGLRDAQRLQRLVAASAALLANERLNLTPYVQQLLPAVLTCLVAKRIGVRHYVLDVADNQVIATSPMI